jgi:Na+-transporting NADH:ubiquinone oxidoreductase subunit NqrB
VPKDPRWLQILFLSSFLCFGLFARDFPLWHAPLVFATCLATQLVCARLLRVRDNGWLSPVITSFGLTLLLRSDLAWPFVLAALVAIASKFVVRIRGRHFLNPANAGLCAAMLVTPHAWCSPTQWGESALLLLWILALGLAVAHRAFRSDASLAFLATYVALKAARVFWLGQRLPVLGHQLESGSLLLFTFFMISDPKTTPQKRSARIAFAAAVACVAFFLQLHFVNNAVVWALLFCAPLTPLLDAQEPTPCLSASQLSPSVSH